LTVTLLAALTFFMWLKQLLTAVLLQKLLSANNYK